MLFRSRGATGAPPSPGPRRCRRTGGGGKAGNGSGPRQARGSETHQGAAPGSSRWGAERGGRADGEGHRRGGAGGVRPRDTNATEPAVEAGVAARATARGMASKRPAGGGEASRPLGRTAGSHRQRPPSTGAVPRHTQDDRLASPATTHTHTHAHPPTPAGGRGGRGERGAHPLTGPHAHRHLQPGAGSRPGRTLSRRVPAAPTQPSHAQPYCAPKAPQPRPPLRAPRALLHPGTPPADRGRETTPT